MKRSIRSSSPLFEQKRSLRREKERQTASLLPEYIKESDRAIIEKLLNLSEFKNAETVFLYYSVGREVSTTALIDKLMDEGRSTALPVSGNNGAMSFYPVIGKDTLRPYLAHSEAFSVCLCRKALLEEKLPAEDTDIAVSLVLSD